VSQIWWLTPVVPALKKLRQEDLQFQASLDYNAETIPLKKNKKRTKFPPKFGNIF
jgi:hypothetical protein